MKRVCVSVGGERGGGHSDSEPVLPHGKAPKFLFDASYVPTYT